MKDKDLTLVQKADALENKIDEISKIKWPLQKQKAAERLVFQAVELVREMAHDVEKMKQAHGWHLEGEENGE